MRGLRSVWSSYHNLNPVVVLVQVSYSHLLSVIRATLVSAGGPDNFIFFDTLLIHINISGRVDLTEKETGLSGLQYVWLPCRYITGCTQCTVRLVVVSSHVSKCIVICMQWFALFLVIGDALCFTRC